MCEWRITLREGPPISKVRSRRSHLPEFGSAAMVLFEVAGLEDGVTLWRVRGTGSGWRADWFSCYPVETWRMIPAVRHKRIGVLDFLLLFRVIHCAEY